MYKNITLISVPILSIMLGSILGIKLNISLTKQAILLSIAAGFLTATLITGIVPEVNAAKNNIIMQIFIMIGAFIGAVLMIILSIIEANQCVDMNSDNCKNEFPLVFVGAISFDIFIHGIMIGNSFSKKMSYGYILATIFDTFICSFVLMNILKKYNRPVKEQYIMFGTLIAVLIVGIFFGTNIHSQLNILQTAILSGLSLIIVLWVIVMELIPQSTNNMKEVKYNWLIPVLWLFSTCLGMLIDWNVSK